MSWIVGMTMVTCMVLKFLCFFYIFQIEYMESRQSRVNDFEMQLQALRVQDAEEYNMVKIKLETDVQVCWERILHQSSISLHKNITSKALC